MFRLNPVVVVGCLVVALACSGHNRESSESSDRISLPSESVASAEASSPVTAHVSDGANVSASSGDAKPTFVEGPNGSVSMKTKGGALVMMLRHDSVLVAFSDSLRYAVRNEVDSSIADGAHSDDSRFGRMIQNAVKTTVSTTLREVLDKARGFPVSTLRGVSYENGAIEFDYKRKPILSFDEMKDGDESFLEKFHPADAARFVGAVRARLPKS